MDATAPVAADAPVEVPLANVEPELERRLRELQPADVGVAWARMSTLVIYCDSPERARQVAGELPAIVAAHPARVLLLVAEPGSSEATLTAEVSILSHRTATGYLAGSEQVTLHARGTAVERLGFNLRPLLVGDLPINLWWAAAQPPPSAGPLLHDLAEHASQVIYDSIGWPDPARGVAITASWIAQAQRWKRQARWCVVSDLNWRRLKSWRRLITQGLDPASAPDPEVAITEVLVEHGPHAVVQAWELVSWLASRLRWRVQAGRMQPNVEITWQAQSGPRAVRLRIRRLEKGPPEVRRVRIAFRPADHPVALDFTVADERHLAVMPEAVEGAAPRSLAVRREELAGLVARQLSDRDSDAIFRQSMEVAQVLAQSVLR